MTGSRKPPRALWALSALGVAAVLATIVLLLSIEREIVARHRADERAANVRHAKECADLLRGGVLLARLREAAARHPEITSLLEIADEIRAELGALAPHEKGDHRFHVLVVDDRLLPVWPVVHDGDRDLRPCARHILEGEERVYVLPHDCVARGDPPDCLCFTCPIQRDGQLLGGLVVHRQLAPVEDTFTALDRTMAWAVILSQGVLLVALGAIACWARKALDRAEQQRAKDERLVALGNLAAGVAHEIRNPLNTIALTCRYLERLIGKAEPEPEVRAEANTNFEIIASELARLTRTLDDVVLLAKPSELALRDCDLEAALDGTLALFARELEEAGIRLVRERAGALPVSGDPDRLGQVFANIVRNSIQAMRDGGTLSVTSEVAGGQARVAFADTGPGIPPASLRHIFEPYFTTKRSGLGLGLALSLRIVQAHRGTLSVANGPQGGALVTVALPLQPDSPEARHGG